MSLSLARLSICSLLLGCAAPAFDVPGVAASAAIFRPSIPIGVMKPGGGGPFPAVVMLHDCSGLGQRSSRAAARWWGKLLQDKGYVVLIPDSFSTRGHGDGVCTDPSPSRAEVNPERRVRDAYEALAYARSLAFVDGTRVGVMGGSHGGSTTLAAMADPEGARSGHGFSAAIALYPGCNARYGDWHPGGLGVYKPLAPTLILVGEKDDWTPAEPCRQLAERSRAQGYPVAVKIYPGAHHSFDSDRPVRYVETRVNGNAPGGRGATTGGNPEAWADSIREVTAFFAKHLQDAL